jgi:hypothetical protein
MKYFIILSKGLAYNLFLYIILVCFQDGVDNKYDVNNDNNNNNSGVYY